MSWETWSFAFGVTVPNLLMLLIGILLRRWRLLDDRFCDSATRLVFNLSLPCLLFFSIATSQASLRQNVPLVLYGAAATLLSFLLLEWASRWLVADPRERGIFVQGGFRANTAIVGLAYCASAYGSEGVAIGSLYMAVTVILFNVLSVITLTRSLYGDSQQGIGWRLLLRGIALNPLIIAIVLGLLWAASGWPMVQVVQDTGHFLAAMALPLALLCAGASIDWRAMFGASNVAGSASLAKLVLLPIFMTGGAWLLGFRHVTLGVIFLLSSTPTAAASYVMTRAMGGNATLAANIIAITTLGSFFTTALGLYFLRQWGVI
ncbi:transporter [Edwardsiella hoshinae]|uniref:Auxin efflux carrier n=1 Tax=Edwardsiella hoshinae TaxID=93378 RepID=A0A376D9T3_9GAMM|nr:AEC family transporter [Edwardsiella hoshinae]AOV96059.1 transporter [Edwardsiella hoshinae]QPR28036.1 AEC family transporter [Edwardsiella hoshinae]STC85069.1 auxin efflux carrier [Edwardsiella hoshinae]